MSKLELKGDAMSSENVEQNAAVVRVNILPGDQVFFAKSVHNEPIFHLFNGWTLSRV